MIHKSLLLTGLAIAPMLNSIPAQTNSTNIQLPETNIEEQAEPESCTFMYVGKDVSSNGKALVARCGDSIPRGMNLHAQIFQHNELANVVTKGKNGFEWQMPSTTYKYISTPRNPIVKNGLHWEVSAVNEMGVCVSATLSCNTYKGNGGVLTVDPLETSTGITEDNIAQIVGATASSARQGVETIAKIIDEKGSGESNAIMIQDKDEVWYMEMYTGHHYVAIKMPNDKACTIGNEFMLDTIAELNLGSDDYITSKDIISTFGNLCEFDSSGEKTIEHLNLYKTFAGGSGARGSFANNCHMRTWRGRNMFAIDSEASELYEIDNTTKVPTKKYSAFWTPKNKLDVNDVIQFMRDRFESILENNQDPNYQVFTDVLAKEGSLRSPSSNTTYQVHVMYVDPDLPTELSAQEWVAFSSASYTPFVPINAGVTTLDPHYTHVIKDYGWDENAACCIYKRLYSIADLKRTNYGLPIESYVTLHEDIWQKHYNELISQIKSESLDIQKNVLTNFCTQTQLAGIYMSQNLFNDLTWFIANAGKDDIFKPLSSLEYYGRLYGWSYEFNDNVATLKNGGDVIKLDCHYEEKPAYGWIMGKLTVNGESQGSVRAKVVDNIVYMDHELVKDWVIGDRALSEIQWQDFYITKNTKWMIPTIVSVSVVAAAGFASPFIVHYVKQKKLAKKKQSVNV